MRILILFAVACISTSAVASTAPVSQSYDVNSAEPGSLYFATEKPGRVVRAPFLSANVHMTITGPIVRTRVVQQFTNGGNAWVEGIYTYPLPKGSAVDTLEMKVGDRVIVGELKEKAEAKRTFEAAKRAGKRASLVVQRRPNIFSTRLANIGPGETIEIAIEYQDMIAPRDNQFELRFPMVVRPRFNPGIPLDDRQARAGWGFDTDEVPDGSQITQPWLHDPSGTHNPLSLTVELAAGFDLGMLESPSHQVAIDQDTTTAQITLAEGAVPADQDFILRWQPKPTLEPTVGQFSETTTQGTHKLLMLMPPSVNTEETDDHQPRDLTIILDKSGSMSGQAIRQAKSAVRRALMRLKPSDRINLVAFDNMALALFEISQPATDRTVEVALDFLDDIEADGGTNMASALDISLPGPSHSAASGSLQQIIFITDGAVGNEANLMAMIKQNLGNARLFTVGIGSAPNSYFMEEAAYFGRGTYMNITMNDDVHTAMATLFSKIESPQITDIALKWPTKDDQKAPVMAAEKIADLYAGEPIILAARAESFPQGDLVITGNMAGEPWSMAVPLKAGGEGVGVSKLWARRMIGAVNRDYIGRYGSDVKEEQRTRVLELALAYHLVSDFTSLVAVEQKVARPARQPLFRRETPANLPAGMDWHKRTVFTITDGLVATSAPQLSTEHIRPRATATPMYLYLALGGTLLLIGTCMLLLNRRVAARR